jgi:tetratricopeptide (TPR) repeat protein
MPSPTLAEFEFEIGARIARGDGVGADAAAAACLAAFPSNRSVWLLGSFAALCAGKKESALALVERCLAADPTDVQYLLQQAECLMALGRRSEALAAAAAAGASPRADFAAFNAIGQFLVNAREYHLTLEIYDRAVAAAPQSVPALVQRAVLHRFLGNFALAARDYEAILAISPLNPDALKCLVDIEPQSPQRNCVAALETALAAAPPASVGAAVLHFALAKSQEDLGEYASSWRHLTAANRLERGRSDYDAQNDRRVIDEIISGFAEVEPRHPDTTRARPIFIVGLPRTGTTLVERILGSHSQVHSAGELPALSQAIAGAVNGAAPGQAQNWGEFAARLGRLDGAPIAREYLALSEPQRGNRARFSDKQPTNFFYCALILRAFPGAHIVHLTRHPLAACYAIYKTRFDAGFPFAYDLDELGDFYIGYRRLMQHWHRVLPGRILDVAYEDIVGTQDAATRRLLEHLELPFEPACLDFHLNPAPMTNIASAAQVRQPLYDSSLHQWRHYSDELAPLRARLEAAGIQVA